MGVNKKDKNNFDKKKMHAQIRNSLKITKEVGLVDGVFFYTDELTIREFAAKINKNVNEIIKYFFNAGIMMNVNQKLTEDQIGELCLEFGFDFQKEVSVTKENIFETLELDTDKSKWKSRPPVVTIVGHVDHGKTTLLDSIRNTNVTKGEFGGITQQIGAYQIKYKESYITFLDTPGHEAFTEMRARGTNVTDIVILVVAADDGIMPQTQEAIDHAKASNSKIITFINKCDKQGSKPDAIKSELMSYEIIAEEYGGDVPFIVGSAITKEGIDKLLETILVLAEIDDLRADHDSLARGVVIEAELDKNRGPVATVLVQHGILRKKDLIVVGGTYGLVRDLEDENGKKMECVKPSQPAIVLGLNETPLPGDKFLVVGEEKLARNIADAQKQKIFDKQNSKINNFSLDSLKEQVDSGELKSINIIIKADTQGSVEALKNSLEKIEVAGINVFIIRSSVGAISQSDITLASASSAIIYGFNVRPTAVVRKKAEEEKVDIRLHNIIYKVLEEIEAAAKGLLDPEMQEIVTGQAEVRALFRHSQVGTIAGCHVISGVINRGSKIRVLRDGVVVYSGEISSLKHEKVDIKEAKEGFECGITIKNYNDIKENDIIEGYKSQEVEKNG